MAEATMTTVDGLLKEVYEGQLQEQYQNETTAIKRLERTSAGVVETVGGKYVDFPIKVKRNPGIGYRAEAEQLPSRGRAGYAAVHVPLRYGYLRLGITGQVMELAEKNYQAFASAFDTEMEGLKEDGLKDSNRIVYGDSSGLLASVTADGANTVTVNNIQYLDIGMKVDIRTRSTGASVAADREITNIVETTYPAGTVTYDGADVAATANEGLYRTNNYASGTKREPSGLGLIVDATTTALHGVDPATQPKWKSVIRNNSASPGTNRALSEGAMIELCDAIRINGGRTSVILGSLGVRRAYFNLLTQQRRYADTKEFAGGFNGLVFNYGREIPMVEDVDHPPNKMYFLDESKIKIYQSRDWHFLDREGHMLKWVTDFDEWELTMAKYWELGTNQRNAQGALTDITEG